MFINYFNPISDSFNSFKENLNQNQIGFHVQAYYEDFPDIDRADVALIFVPENRGGGENSKIDCVKLRESIYALFQGDWKFRIVDFGDLKLGNNLKDTYFALNDLVSNLLSQSVFPIIFGGLVQNDL